MRRIFSLFIICLFSLVVFCPRTVVAKTQTADSSTFTGADLFASCQLAVAYDKLPQYSQEDFGNKHLFEIGTCLGYFAGWTQGVNGLLVVQDDGKPYVIHFVPNVQIIQGVTIYVDYVAQHRELLIKPADFGLTKALLGSNLVTLTPWIPKTGPASLN